MKLGDRVRLRTSYASLLALVLAFGCGPVGPDGAWVTAQSGAGGAGGDLTTGAPGASTSPEPGVVVAGAAGAAAAAVDATGAGGAVGAPAVSTPAPVFTLPSAETTSTTPEPALPEPFAGCGQTMEPSNVTAALAAFAVTEDGVARKTLYSWTTAAQIEELRSEPTLLTRSASEEGEVGRAQGLILGNAADDPIAALLAEERFSKKRFAWSNPWATRLGWTGEDYGDRLLAITLRDEAWVGRLRVVESSAALEWAFFDLAGNSVAVEQVLATPERLGAVYFSDRTQSGGCDFERVTLGAEYREYFLCNEGMLEGWSVYGEESRAELDRGIATLDAFRTVLDTADCVAPGVALPCWKEQVLSVWHHGSVEDLLGTYAAALAFPNDLYMPTSGNLSRLIERLRSVPFDAAPLRHSYLSEGQESTTEENTE